MALVALAGVFLPGTEVWAGDAPSAEFQKRSEQTAEERAADLKDQGNAAMDARRHADALSLYRAAYELHPTPVMLYNVGRAYQALGNHVGALSYIQRFDEEADPALKKRVPNLAGLITVLRGRVATLSLRVNVKGAEVRLDDRTLGRTPFDGPIRVEAGKAVLEVRAEGYFPHEQRLNLTGNRTHTIDVNLDRKNTFGILSVRTSEPNVRVLIDGKFRGMVPLEVRLRAGQHKLELLKDGFETVTTSTVVQVGKRKEITFQMEEVVPLYENWLFWTGVGAVVAAGTVSAIIIHGKEKDADVGDIPPGQVEVGLSF